MATKAHDSSSAHACEHCLARENGSDFGSLGDESSQRILGHVWPI